MARELAAQRARHLPHYVIVDVGTAPVIDGLSGPWTLHLEDCEATYGSGALLPAMPLGRHRLEAAGETCWILAAPPRLLPPPRGWGVTLPLYGLRGRASGGLADYADLTDAVRAFGAHGAGFVGFNPVHAGFPTDPQMFSPYSPSHRRRLSVMHVSTIETAIPGSGELIDYEPALKVRRAALEQEFDAFLDDGAFAAFMADEGSALSLFAIYEALADVHGPTWNRWPEPFRDPANPAVAGFVAENQSCVQFHKWLQFRADTQLASAAQAAKSAGMRHGLYLDLAVGTHPHGAESWMDPSSFIRGASLGAPPDAFSETGQTWNVAPFDPQWLVSTGFAALADTLKAQLRHAGILRIDHILGFDRAFWVPEGGLPGSYISMPRDAMLAVARIEACRAGAVVVGEDLGNVPAGLREALADAGILGCRVAMFEPDLSAEDYPESALTSFGTHDLPTWLGWCQGRDLEARHRIGAMTEDQVERARAERGAEVARMQDRIGGASADALHLFLGATRSSLVALQIEDILEVADQPNLPGTVGEYPNWRRQLPVAARELRNDPRLASVGAIMRAAGRTGG